MVGCKFPGTTRSCPGSFSRILCSHQLPSLFILRFKDLQCNLRLRIVQ
jgi:hypothetical protein